MVNLPATMALGLVTKLGAAMVKGLAEQRTATRRSVRVASWIVFGGSVMAAFCMLSKGVLAAPPQGQDRTEIEPTSLPQVIVEAERQALKRRISQFVTILTEQVGSYESLARWGVMVCPAVTGLPQAQGEFILQRISAIALSAGAPLGSRDCKPNLFVMVTSEPSRLVKEIWSRNPSRFPDSSGLPASQGEIRRFIDDPRPIRAWYGAELVGAMGNALDSFQEMPSSGRAPKSNRLSEMSRIRIDDLLTIRSALVVVDTGRITGLNIGAVADYVALVGLAEVNLDANFSNCDSVLRMFTVRKAEAQAFSQLGAWDAAFLKALYKTEQADKMQRDSIVDSMLRDRSVLPQP